MSVAEHDIDFNNIRFRYRNIAISITSHQYNRDKYEREVAIVWPSSSITLVGHHSARDIDHFIELLEEAKHRIDTYYPFRKEEEPC